MRNLSFPIGRCALVAAAVLLASPSTICSRERGPAWKRHTIDRGSRGADGTRLDDVNGDGFLDIATGWEEGGEVCVYIHPGPSKSKGPWPKVRVGSVGSPEDAVFADLDGDGAVDVVSSCEGAVKSLFVHWAPADRARYLEPGAWKTEAIPATRGRASWMFCLPLQLGGEGGVDLIAGAKGRGAQVGRLVRPSAPRDLAAWKWRPLCDAGWIMSIVAVDMDGDGDADLLISDRKGPRRGCLWLENPGPREAREAAWREHRIGAGDREVMFLTPCDLDRDGLLDVLAAVRGKQLVYHRRTENRPERWESSSIRLPDYAGTGKAVAVGDIDLDGRLDVVSSCENARDRSGVLWLSRSGKSNDAPWDDHEISGPAGAKYDLVELIDLDSDGDLDVLTCEERENLGVIWYENPTRSASRR